MGGVIFLIIVMVVTEFRYFGFQFISFYFGFYVIGYYLRNYNIKFSLRNVIVLGLAWFCLALFWRMKTVPSPLHWAEAFFPSSLITYGYRYISALIGSVFFVALAMNCMNKDNKFCRWLSYFGTISLGIYIVHIFIGKYIEPIYTPLFASDTSVFFVIFDFTIKLVLSCVIVYFIKKVPIASLLLLGQKELPLRHQYKS